MSLRAVAVKLAMPALALVAVAALPGTASAAGPRDVSIGQGNYLLGIGYQNSFEGGARILFYGRNCADVSPGDQQSFDKLPSGWVNRISSFTAGPDCDALLYRKAYEGGASLAVLAGTTDDKLPGLANRASSVAFTAS